MPSLTDLLNLAKKARDEAAQGHFAAATQNAALCIAGAAESAQDLGFKAGPDDDAIKAEIKTCLEECKASADAVKCTDKPVGKLPWDGSILKALIEAFLKFAPLFI